MARGAAALSTCPIDLYAQALALYRQTGNGVGEVRTLNNLGNTYRAMRAWPEATREFESCLAAAERHGVSSAYAYTWVNLGLLAAARGLADVAERWFERALDDERTLGEGLAASDLRQGLCRLAVNRGQLDVARRWLHEALLRVHQRDHRQDRLSVLVYAGEWLAACGERTRAAALWAFVGGGAGASSLDADEARRLAASLVLTPAQACRARRDAAAFDLEPQVRALLAETAGSGPPP